MRDATAQGRVRFVRLHQELGRRALVRGDLEAARAALCLLEPGDFDGATVIVETCLRVLREPGSSDRNILSALKILSHLPIRSA